MTGRRRDRGGVSDLPGLLAALGIKKLDHLQLLECGQADHIEPTIPALILFRPRHGPRRLARAFSPLYPADHLVQVVRLAASGRLEARALALSDLGRVRHSGELQAAFVPAVAGIEMSSSMRGLRQLVAHLRGPNGCPWDREQTLKSLAPFAIEEAYEVVEEIMEGDHEGLKEELGDLLLQVVIEAQVAQDEGHFDLTDVMRHLGAKLVRRHPHVFGSARAESAAQVLVRWEQLKAEERPEGESVLAKIPKSQPALRAAQDIQRRVSDAGFDWPSREGLIDKLHEEVSELLEAQTPEQLAHELGDVLFVLAKVGRESGVDAELALRTANARFTRRFQFIERELARDGRTVPDSDLAELLELWALAKAEEANSPQTP